MRKPQKAALAIAIALIAPLSACSGEADTTPEQSQTQGATEIPEASEDADGTSSEDSEVDNPEVDDSEDAESTDDVDAGETDDSADAKDETETALAALKKIEDLRADVTDTRHSAAHLRGKIKGDTFEALGKTNGALGISTGAAKAAQHNESHAPKKIDEALSKIERAQSQLQRAQQSLNDSSDSSANEIADELLALIEGLDGLRDDLAAL